MRELNVNEIQEVNGGFGPAGASLGAVIGAAGYLGSAATSGSFSWSSFGAATAFGGLSGWVGGPIGSAAARFLLPRISFMGGAATGL